MRMKLDAYEAAKKPA